MTMLQRPAELVKPIEQPGFPLCDLLEDNLDILSEYLFSEPGIEARASLLRQNHQLVYYVANQALNVLFASHKAEPTTDQYLAFAHGFATSEAITMAVRPPRADNVRLAARQTLQLLIAPGEMVDMELADWHDEWAERRPNTYLAIVRSGERRHETMDQLQTRLFAAHLALQMQSPLAA